MPPSPSPDPLQTTPDGFDRLFYAPGVLLDADDFQAEQFYHRSRLARTLAYLHGSGTVAGLWVYREPPLEPGTDNQFPSGREERLEVEPGLAIDRLGRLIEVPRNACVRLNRWFDAQTTDDLTQGFHGAPFNGVVVDVFLRFVICERGKTPAFAAGPFDALDAVQPSRLRDGYELSLVIRQEAEPPLPRPFPDLTLPSDPGTPENERQRRDAIARAITDPDQRRRTILHNTLFNAWREGTDQRDVDGNLTPLPEHATGQDTTNVLLARVVIPATVTDNGRPTRTPTADVQIDNYIRPFVYSTGALARWVGV